MLMNLSRRERMTMSDLTAEKFYESMQSLTDSLHQTTSNLEKMLANHETRITVLERHDEWQQNTGDGQWLKQLVPLLTKAVIIALTSIATLTGAGGILKTMFEVTAK